MTLLMVNQQSKGPHTVTSKCEHFNKISSVKETIFVQSIQKVTYGASTKKNPTNIYAIHFIENAQMCL